MPYPPDLQADKKTPTSLSLSSHSIFQLSDHLSATLWLSSLSISHRYMAEYQRYTFISFLPVFLPTFYPCISCFFMCCWEYRKKFIFIQGLLSKQWNNKGRETPSSLTFLMLFWNTIIHKTDSFFQPPITKLRSQLCVSICLPKSFINICCQQVFGHLLTRESRENKKSRN